MNLISLHRKYVFINFQNSICSIAAFISLSLVILSIALPFVWIFKLNNNKLPSSSDVIKYEQPIVKFKYKYIFIAMNSMENDGKVMMCSSFDFLKQRVEMDNCAKIKFTEKDANYDGVPDEINFTYDFHTVFSYGVKSISLVIFLDTRLEEQCKLCVPSAIIVKKTFVNNMSDSQIVIRGSLLPTQRRAIMCPFFLKSSKLHFFYEKLQEKSATLEEFHIERILDNLERNPVHFRFEESSTDQYEFHRHKTTVQIIMKIPEVPVRYNKSFWQALNDIWINYLAIFVITFYVSNYLLKHLFENRWVMAREQMPSTKNV